MPWFPSRARKQKNDATAELYTILKTHIDDRKETGRAEMDAMQVLLDMGDGVNDIVQVGNSTILSSNRMLEMEV
jgi:hypothetical protein